VHAQLYPGEENSGKLVALLRRESKTLAQERGATLILSDGPPGIGCPVISAFSGIDQALVVTEPTPSGFHDLGRVVELCTHFRVPAAVIVNKCDLNKNLSRDIQVYCSENGLPVLAELPHDPDFVHAMVRGWRLPSSVTARPPGNSQGLGNGCATGDRPTGGLMDKEKEQLGQIPLGGTMESRFDCDTV
jgi:MinD superfamily P-loop ATPase